MKMIGELIVEGTIKKEEISKYRTTVRAVILKDNKVYMLHSNMYNDYIFPGGGVKRNETLEEALRRELNEELGAINIKIIEPVGYTKEYRYGINSQENKYEQTSYYFLCEIAKIGKTNLNERETNQGLKPYWVEIDDVIKHNNKELNSRDEIKNRGFLTVLKRENLVLNYIKEKYKNA